MTCTACGAAPPQGVLSCRAEKPPLVLCAPCYSKHIKIVHDGTEVTDQQVEDTEAWRQINAAIAAGGGNPVVGWFLLERPEAEPDAPEDDWVCIAFTTADADATAWHEPGGRRVARPVMVARQGSA